MEEEKGTERPRDASGRFVAADEAESHDEEPQQGEEPQRDEEPQQSDEPQQGGGGDSGVEDISDTTAPSIGPGSTVKREPVEERLARHDQSDVDAMGQDKRRQVVGKTYGPTIARQVALYALFLVVVAAIGFGVKILVDHNDQPPKHFKAEAPWARPKAPQIPPPKLQ